MDRKRTSQGHRTDRHQDTGPVQGHSPGGLGGSKGGSGMGLPRGDFREEQPDENRGPATTTTVGEDTGSRSGKD